MNKPPVWSGDWPIPKRIILPGLRIRVKLLSPDELADRGTKDGLWTYNPPSEESAGYAVIYINSAKPLAVQRYILWHELQHVGIEGLDVMIEKFPEHVQSNSMAAMAAVKATEVKEAIGGEAQQEPAA